MQPQDTVTGLELGVHDAPLVVAGELSGLQPEASDEVVVRRFQVGIDQDRDSSLHTCVDSRHFLQHLQ